MTIFSSSKPSSPSHSYRSSPLRFPSPSTPRHTFSASIMEENVDFAESIVSKWDVEATTYSKVDSLFREDRREAREFLRSVKGLQTAMHFFVSENLSSDNLVRAQKLMQKAMRRLEKEFYFILSRNRNYLDPESVSRRSSRLSGTASTSDVEDESSEDELQVSSDAASETERISETAMSDLKAVADCMISSGYTKECLKIYIISRKSIVDETLYHLGVEKLTYSQIQKMDWDAVDIKIKTWLNAVKIAVNTLFRGERILCDYVFSASEKIRECCFTALSRDGAATLFGFPELVAKCKKSPEKMFRTLDLYESISDLWSDIELIFPFESTSAVRSQAVACIAKLGDNVRSMLSDFEAAIQKDPSKSPVPGGGVHPLTRYVMNYMVFLADYSGVLSEILADWPLQVQSPLPESYFPSPGSDDGSMSIINVRLAWLILVLLCKLDGKAELYKDVSLSYLFLANNLNYVASKVKASNLRLLLGEDWLMTHEAKVRQYAANYERMGWNRVTSSLPENPTASISPEEANECFKRFSSGFEDAYRKQISWVVPDPKLREEIKISVAKKLMPTYRAFYDEHAAKFRRGMGVGSVVRFAPEDLGNYLSDLFHGAGVSGSTSSSL